MTSWCYNLLCIGEPEDSDESELHPRLAEAIQNIKDTDNLMAQETIKVLNSNQLEIRPLESLCQEEYQIIRADGDPEHRDHLAGTLGLFVHPNRIFISLSQHLIELERTIVHEVQHYCNHQDGYRSPIEDEMLAIEAEDRYSGRYITRKYIKDLRACLEPDF